MTDKTLAERLREFSEQKLANHPLARIDFPMTLSEAREAAAALSAEGMVPVAWRWRYSPEHQWHYVEREHQRSAQAYDWEPVYTAPKQKEGKP